MKEIALNSNSFNQRKFITDIYECEKTKYILERHIRKLNQQIDSAKDIGDYEETYAQENRRTNKAMSKLPTAPKRSDFDTVGCIIHDDFLSLLVYAPPAVGLIVNLVKWIIGLNNGADFWPWPILPGFIACLIVAVIIFGGPFIYDQIRYNKEYNLYKQNLEHTEKQNEENKKFNQENYKEYKQLHGKYVQKRKGEIAIVTPPLYHELDEAKRQLKKVNGILNEFYSLRINDVLCLHPKYQGLIPISIIYGYFDTGRCSALEGHEGAYNLYEDEKMKGMIINQLNTVIKQLNQLQSAMYYVEEAIKECNYQLSSLNETSNKMVSSLTKLSSSVNNSMNSVQQKMKNIETNTANSAYYSEVSARMTAFNTGYQIFKDC